MSDFNLQSYSPSIPLISAGISAGGGLLGSIIGAITGDSAATSQYNRQRKLMKLQNDYAVENWNMENAYNTPSAQIERLRAAGINPNAVFGSSVQNGASPLGSPSSGVPAVPDYSGVLSSVNSIIPNILSLEQSNETNARAFGQDINNRYLPRQLDAAVQEVRSRERLNNQQAVMLQEQISVLLDKTPAEVKLIYQQAQLVAQQVLESKSRQGLVDAQRTGVNLDNDVKQVIANLARLGVVVNGDGMTTLITALLSPHSADLVRSAISNLLSNVGSSFSMSLPSTSFNVHRNTRSSGVR